MIMENKDLSLLPASYLTDGKALSDPAGPYADESRLFQGIPGIECTKCGTYYAVFYTGMKTEEAGNFLLLYKSRDPHDFGKAIMAVLPPAPEFVRCYDPCLWIDPSGRLNLFWAQSYGLYDGRMGVWRAVCDDPDADMPVFSPPKRIANGIMMNKPIVTRGGTWLLPCSIWKSSDSELNRLPDERYSNVYRSLDGGSTFELIGHSDYPNRLIDEHMIYERGDGSLVMLIRASDGIGMAESYDGGVTWRGEHDSKLGGPCSRFCVRRLKSGRLLLVNHYKFTGRNNLTAMLSEDDGKSWIGGLLIDARQNVSYPDVCESPDGMINIIYDRERYKDKEILLARVTEDDILEGRLAGVRSELSIIVSKACGKPDEM